MVRVLSALAFVGALSACGRFGFDAQSGAGGNGGGGDDDATTSDGGLGDDGTGSASGWSPLSPQPGTTNILTSAIGFAANDWWVGGVGPEIDHFDGTSWIARPGPARDINMLWALSATDVWEVGPACDVNRWNGSTWTPNPPTGCSNDNYIAIGGLSATDLWLVGGFGTVEHLVGTTWTSLPQGNSIDLWSVWAASANNVYFSGIKGTIKHWTGSMADESIATNQVLTTVWGSSANDVWVVGASGLIYHKVNNGAWTQVASPTTSFLYGLWGTAANDIWAVGDNATVLHYDGSQWSNVSVTGLDPAASLRWITGVPGAGIIAVGTSGSVITHP